MQVFKPQLSSFFNLKLLVPSVLIIEVLYRIFAYPYLIQNFSNFNILWFLGPNIFAVPISFLKYYYWIPKGGFDFMTVIVDEGHVEGMSALKNLKEAIPLQIRHTADIVNFEYGAETRKATNPRIAIDIQDIDWDKSFKSEIFLWPRVKFGFYKKIYSKKGDSILLHWLLGDQQIKEIKDTLQQKYSQL